MNRREFLKRTGLTSAALALSPSLFSDIIPEAVRCDDEYSVLLSITGDLSRTAERRAVANELILKMEETLPAALDVDIIYLPPEICKEDPLGQRAYIGWHYKGGSIPSTYKALEKKIERAILS